VLPPAAATTWPCARATLELQDAKYVKRRCIDDRYTGHHESAIMRMKLTHITSVLAAGAAALAIAAAPAAAAEPTAAQTTSPSTAVAREVFPAGYHGGGFHGGFHGGYHGGSRQSLRLGPWGWPPRDWHRRY
jgi:hypothetical protein